MGDVTGISWCHHTFNPWIGCSKVSDACKFCYAERDNAFRKWNGGTWGPGAPRKITSEANWRKPLQWNKAAERDGVRRRVFTASLADVFDAEAPADAQVRLFDLIEECSALDWLVLTKRPENALAFYRERYGDGPLPSNIWQGVSVENQKAADERIPLLLQIQAAVRFLSMEPLLGPVDLSRWLMPRTMFTPENAPATWSEVVWPEWVPEHERESIAKFWLPAWGRSPRDWAKAAIQNDSPPIGARMVDSSFDPPREGRWLYCWNNIGRLIDDEGVSRLSSVPRSDLFDARRHYWLPLHWIITGGESGPNARPSHPDWFRSIRDQCVAAGVPFHFKQWGEYVSVLDRDRDDPDWRYDYSSMKPTSRLLNAAGGCGFHGEAVHVMKRVGKKKSGHLLDGVEWMQFPEVPHA